MEIEKISIAGFRNYLNAEINFNKSTLVIGANDSGKTNLIYAMRLLLDKSLAESELEPSEADFHFELNGKQSDDICIDLYFKEVTEDAVLSILKGKVGDDGKCILRYAAKRDSLSYTLWCGPALNDLEEVAGRYYLKYLNLRYVKSQRDLEKYINAEKRQLLKISQENRCEKQIEEDKVKLTTIEKGLSSINKRVQELHYVKGATEAVNAELSKLSHDLSSYSVHLDSGAIETQQFIDSLKLGASTAGARISLGGDGRNNQILLSLWKAKSEREFDPDSEVVFYCIEEPEAHLHPHQQRKLADYLISELPGQTFITTHSPQITARFSPESIVHIKLKGGKSHAASGGCAKCIDDAWDELGYRMSILPAEAFFAKSVFLVEGPSEQLFYTELAKCLDIDLDFYNISILGVDGVQFQVYVNILNAMEIPWTIRTDNDLSDVTKKKRLYKNLAGINRCLTIAGFKKQNHMSEKTTHDDLISNGLWQECSRKVNKKGIFLSKIDLEHDLAIEMQSEILEYTSKADISSAITYLQAKKAIRMREFLSSQSSNLSKIRDGEIARALFHCINQARG
ncbi:ATP-dependent nuclease [Comamonas sp. B21-038]|uniref:ATP-dependent nuclease n=1 Tax=Comamonas sp. B21-038 TaxID=2918299 RepID=UPI001EFC0858|nr:AAA family ATPase [Comamonas sp. B21-038]ULR91405.1 AAA family ATPase [Comamonas sp. B21-038]